MSSHQTSNLSSSPRSPGNHHPFHHTSSPPLPNIHSLSISSSYGQQQHYAQPGPQSPISNGNGSGNGAGDYRYNGVFGPPAGSPPTQSQGWGHDKSGSRSGLPTNWYDPPTPFDAYRNPSPALSPPTSSSSGPSSASVNPYHTHPPPYPDYAMGAIGMVNTPSPPPLGFMGMSVANSAPNLHSIHSGMPAFGSQSLASLTRGGHAGWRNSYTPPNAPADDDVIPTAIVIKNIPFSVPREALLSIIESLGAPLPYAFNYHHDSGVFRGLAFANFRQSDEAAAVVAALNGYDVAGRKLRVEYKKVLQPGEKDRIEREKALKRMRSVQGFDKVNMEMPPPLPSLRSLNSAYIHPTPPLPPSNDSPPQSAVSTSTSSDNLPTALDMNDSSVLDIYSRCLLFKEDRMRDELSFSKNLSAHERRVVHLVAQRLGLSSGTKDGGDDHTAKCVVVSRIEATRPALTSSVSASTAISSTYLSPYGSEYYNPHHQTTPTSASPGLRIKKSMPDLRGFNSSIYRDPLKSLATQRSSGNLREVNREYVSMGATAGRRAGGGGVSGGAFGFLGDTPPPVPPMPSGMGGHRSTLSVNEEFAPNSAPSRHPRGPAGESRGFGGGLGESAPIGRSLRQSASAAVMRSSNGFGGFGKGVREEDEGEEGFRTRESLDL